MSSRRVLRTHRELDTAPPGPSGRFARLASALARTRAQHSEAEYRVLVPVLRRLGYHLVRANYYSPIPDVESLAPELWTEPAPMPGVDFDLDAQLGYLREELAPYLREFSPPADPPGDELGFHHANPYYGSLDADLLYAMVRRHRPPRIVELGSGYTTLVIAGARKRNNAEGTPARHEVFDPFPSDLLHRVRAGIALHAQAAVDVPLEVLLSLQRGEMLVIDTTHTVKPGGEVTRLILEVLPRLAAGVIVHIHDFFRPFEYPRVLFERYGVFWQEHYLVQALLIGSGDWEILCANHALARLRLPEAQELVPQLTPEHAPSALWIRRRNAGQ
jgi:hypothetical protein